MAKRPSTEAVLDSTGRSWDEWFALLDEWGAEKHKHPEIARWLSDEHGVDGWWAQSITVAYEQERGLRAPGQMADGTYTVSASKTIAADVDTLYQAFVEDDGRRKWLGNHDFTVRSSRAAKSITAVWKGGPGRLAIGFSSKGPGKSQVALAHERIADARSAEELKSFWRERLSALKELLESGYPR